MSNTMFIKLSNYVTTVTQVIFIWPSVVKYVLRHSVKVHTLQCSCCPSIITLFMEQHVSVAAAIHYHYISLVCNCWLLYYLSNNIYSCKFYVVIYYYNCHLICTEYLKCILMYLVLTLTLTVIWCNNSVFCYL